jgi:hypothetical protein
VDVVSSAALNFTEKGGIPNGEENQGREKGWQEALSPDSLRRGRLSPPDIPHSPSGRDASNYLAVN